MKANVTEETVAIPNRRRCQFHAARSRFRAIDLENARLDMEAFTELNFLRDMKPGTEICGGDAADKICRTAGDSATDLIVILTHDRGWPASHAARRRSRRCIREPTEVNGVKQKPIEGDTTPRNWKNSMEETRNGFVLKRLLSFPLSGCEMSALKLCLFILSVVATSALAQTPSGQNSSLPSQAEQVHGIAVPVPKEIFRSLDQFRNANWPAVRRPEVARWKSHGDQAQIATLLGIVIAEGFIAMEAKDSTEVKNLGNSVLSLAGGLGVRQSALRRSRSIMEFAEKNKWSQARQEWDGVLSDLETRMINLKSADLAQLISVGGWLRGTEVLSALILQNYSPERSNLIRQPALIDYLEKQLRAMSGDIQARPIVVKLLDGIQTIHSLVESETGPPSEETVRKVHGVCAELVPLSSRRLNESSN